MSVEKITLTPHHDIELNYPRQPMDYYLTFPENGMNDQTGLIVVIGGCPWRAEYDYLLKTLHPHLANTYNCLVAGVNFFGIGRTSEADNTQFSFDETFSKNLNTIYGIEPEQIVPESGVVDLELFRNILHEKGIRRLDPRCKAAATVDEASYQSFGFLPAIDNLTVTGDILNKYPVNKKRLIAFGTSYGGYIANLMGKYAPNTFSAIIDNSGFTRTFMMYVTGMELMADNEYILKLPQSDIELSGVTPSPWIIHNEMSPRYLSDACRAIRSLLIEHHFKPTKTKHYIFHSLSDAMVPIGEKEIYAAIMKKYTDVQFWKIGSNDIDGKIFKTGDHAMNASMRGMFDLVYSSGSQALETQVPSTDFDLQKTHSFFCGMKTYTFSFLQNQTLSVQVIENTGV